MDEGKGNRAAAVTLGAPRGLVRHPHVERPSPQLRVGSGPSGWASSAGFCTAIAAVAVPGHFPLRGLLPRSPRTPWGCPPPPPTPRCGLLAPGGHPTSPPPPAILAIRVPSRSFLIVVTHTWGRTHRDRSGRSPRVPPLAATLRGKCLSGIGEYPNHRRFKPTQLDPQKPLSWVWSRT